MSAHTFHPDPHEHGLADDCPRCAEQAADPVNGLDERNLTRLLELSFDPDRRWSATYNDQVAIANLLNVLDRAGHIGRTCPELFAAHMARFRVQVMA